MRSRTVRVAACIGCLAALALPAIVFAEGAPVVADCLLLGAPLEARIDKPSAPPPLVTESEIRQLVSALRSEKPVQATTPRMRGVLADVTHALARRQIAERLARVRKQRGLDRDVRRWATDGLESLQACAERRFTSRGGEPALQRTLAAVEPHRTALEPLLFEAMRWRLESVPLPVEGSP